AQRGGISRRAEMCVVDAALAHQAYHLLEVQQFLARQGSHFLQQLGERRVAVHQVHCRGRCLLLAVRVINQQFGRMRHRGLQPVLGRRTGEKFPDGGEIKGLHDSSCPGSVVPLSDTASASPSSASSSSQRSFSVLLLRAPSLRSCSVRRTRLPRPSLRRLRAFSQASWLLSRWTPIRSSSWVKATNCSCSLPA